MLIVGEVLGNVNDESWRRLIEGATLDELRLDQWQAQKNRFRLKTAGGVEIAVALERNTHLHDGDILTWDQNSRTAVVARITLKDVLVIRLDAVETADLTSAMRTCFELGHALGNQHWPAVVKGMSVYVPLTVDRKVMASVMKTHAFPGITYDFQPGQEIIPYLAPHEARRLFGGADATPHQHHHHTHEEAGAGHSHE